MAKTINTRVQHKYDTAKNWSKASFVPLRGELIIYGDDKNVAAGSTTSPTIKVGDGTNTIENLKALSGGSAPDLSNYYTKKETYNQAEINNLVSTSALPKPPEGVENETDVLLKYDYHTKAWVMITQTPDTMKQDQILMYSGSDGKWSGVPVSIYNGEVTE